ncbi:hypothetical protein [Paraburkholderia oxyphila]|uniref:hypothetical protein n=1 Tax=Paraburkholderia oxyphila TaxID=614212 RepID=UPI0004806609|nr:hypothetical protein [Paraburkholderia oxyphila]
MNPSAQRAPAKWRRSLIAAIVGIDFVLSLTPQLHWAAGNGTPLVSIGYFLGTCVFITLTLGVMVMIDPDKGGNP